VHWHGCYANADGNRNFDLDCHCNRNSNYDRIVDLDCIANGHGNRDGDRHLDRWNIYRNRDGHEDCDGNRDGDRHGD